MTYGIEALCFALVLRNLVNFNTITRRKDNGSRLRRGLIVSVSFIVGLPEPLSKDREHESLRFVLYVPYIYVYAREAV